MTIGDNFSESLIHKIFSYLSHEDAANSSLLSKTWLQAWLTQPSLKFKVEYGKGNNNRKIVDKIMERYKEEKYPIDKFELDITSSPYHHALAFPRIDNWLDIALQNGVQDVVCKVDVPSYPFPISAFLASKSLRELVLTDHNVLQTLVNCCPLMVEKCSLLTKIELRNLQNIKSLDIRFNFVYGELHERFNICRSSQSLKVLTIDGCKDIGEIDASNLVSFDYEITNVSNQLKNSQTYLSCYDDSSDEEWFFVVLDIDMRFNDVSSCPNCYGVVIPRDLTYSPRLTCFMDRLTYLKN
ncbi:hypothetical protein H5410_044973 [Solanum commersonii]|uniref:F-box domain-containing protein n=1 Tax=Solanum commersonii TaxID=4109 RepID=A0A9J5X8F4_SOLCO|nr:hypothetical protein H5410_044973 [Solanum commersonii]